MADYFLLLLSVLPFVSGEQRHLHYKNNLTVSKSFRTKLHYVWKSTNSKHPNVLNEMTFNTMKVYFFKVIASNAFFLSCYTTTYYAFFSCNLALQTDWISRAQRYITLLVLLVNIGVSQLYWYLWKLFSRDYNAENRWLGSYKVMKFPVKFTVLHRCHYRP